MMKRSNLFLLSLLALGTSSTTAVSAATVGTLDTDVTAAFTEDTQPNLPVDPTDPGSTVDPGRPGTGGPLSLDVAPMKIDFGTTEIKAGENQTIMAKPMEVKDANQLTKLVPNYTQVTDKRGGRLGWTLNVKQVEQLKSASNDLLTGAVINFKNSKIISPSVGETAPTGFTGDLSLTPGSDSTVMSAAAGVGYLTWVQSYGNVIDGEAGGDKLNDGIELFVPSGAAKATTYSGKLVWSLTDTPG